MTGFMELEQNELLFVQGGDLETAINYAGASYAAAALSSACCGAIAASAPTLAVVGCITGGLGFGAVALFCGIAAVASLTN